MCHDCLLPLLVNCVNMLYSWRYFGRLADADGSVVWCRSKMASLLSVFFLDKMDYATE